MKKREERKKQSRKGKRQERNVAQRSSTTYKSRKIEGKVSGDSNTIGQIFLSYFGLCLGQEFENIIMSLGTYLYSYFILVFFSTFNCYPITDFINSHFSSYCTVYRTIFCKLLFFLKVRGINNTPFNFLINCELAN